MGSKMVWGCLERNRDGNKCGGTEGSGKAREEVWNEVTEAVIFFCSFLFDQVRCCFKVVETAALLFKTVLSSFWVSLSHPHALC